MESLSEIFWQKQNILVTGGGGFLGSHIVDILKNAGCTDKNLSIPRKQDFDLRNRSVCEYLVKNISIIIHLAANVGGIGHINDHPGEVYYDNVIMSTELMEAARKAGVQKFVAIGTTCSYPANSSIPCKEETLWNGYPDKETAPYGIAKRMLIAQGIAFKKQYNFNSIFLLPSNLYGPRDHFNPISSHVIPALIYKIYTAKHKNAPFVEVWGSGKATREFLYVQDAAFGILLATEKYNNIEPINLGSGKETSISELIQIITRLLNYHGKIRWNKNMPEGKKRLLLDINRAKTEFNFSPKTSLEKGLKETIQWFLSHAAPSLPSKE